jgi:anti-anti-sigma factor
MAASDGSGPSGFTLAEEADGSWALRLIGDIDVTNASEIETLLREATAEEPRTLAVDLRVVTFLDSAGVRLLLWAHRWQQRAGNYLKVVVDISGLTALFGVA